LAEQILVELTNAVVNYDPELAAEAAKKALKAGLDPVKAIEEGLAKGIRMVGEKFQRGEAFITDLAIAGEAMRVGLQIFEPEIEKRGVKTSRVGTILLGTVAGDIHDIGKNLVGMMLTVNGFHVVDLGKDVATQMFVDAVRKHQPDILGASALLVTTQEEQKKIIDALHKAGLREKVKVIVGGAPVNEKWAKEIGADGYGSNAVEAVKLARSLVGAKS
jgi:corrinoid protein of di/trimethylamine methyltransferase